MARFFSATTSARVPTALVLVEADELVVGSSREADSDR